MNDNPSIKIYVNKIENKIRSKIKTGYYLELLTPKTMKILGSSKKKINKDENSENIPHLEATEVVLIHCNIVSNYYQHCFLRNGQLLNISPKNFIFLKSFDPEFWYIKIWLTDHISKLLEIEDKMNITLVIN